MSDVTAETLQLDTLVVSYSVKELLSQISESVTRIDTKLDTKASVEHVEQVEEKVEDNSKRIAALELTRAKLYGVAAATSFLSGGGGFLLANIAHGTGQ